MRQLIAAVARRLIPPSETLDGYEQSELVEVVFQKTKAYNPQDSWPEMIGVSSVLDFGGGCGLHYKEAHSSTVRWAVVDTPAMVDRAKEFATDRLQFFADISEAQKWLGDVDVMHSNGALQYTPDPEQKLGQLCGMRAKKMLWQRVALSSNKTECDVQSSLLGDNGPGSIRVKEKIVRHTRTKIPERAFLEAHGDYDLAERGADWFRFSLRDGAVSLPIGPHRALIRHALASKTCKLA
jgi:putative methyltransferase (TIGR04325 family)